MSNNKSSKPKLLPGGVAFLLPVLKVLADGKARHRSDICGCIIEDKKFSEAQMRQRLPSGQLALSKRVYFAMTHLRIAGLVKRPRVGFWQITKVGKQFLGKAQDESLDQIDYKLLRTRCRKYDAWYRARRTNAARPSLAGGNGDDLDGSLSLEEQLENTYGQLQSIAESKILARLRKVIPSSAKNLSFERIVMDLLQKMGYGQGNPDWGEVIGGPGDGGIDGVIKEDALGLRKIYMQAKREDRKIGIKDLREFVGALIGKGATKGVFVTTSGFTGTAQKYAEEQKQYNIVLIDGEELVRLMIQYQVGVVCREISVVEKIDENYFSEEQL